MMTKKRLQKVLHRLFSNVHNLEKEKSLEFLLFQNQSENPAMEICGTPSSTRCCLSQNDLAFLTKNYSSNPVVLHSQSLNNLNAPITALAAVCANKNKRAYCRPASIILNENNEFCRHPVLKLCPSTPTPSESDSLASPCSSCRAANTGSHPSTPNPNNLFSFSTTLSDPEHLNQSCIFLRFPSNQNQNNAKFVASSLNENTTNVSNAQNSLLVPFISNNNNNNNNAGIIITTKNHQCQHRSLSEIAAGSSNHSNNSSPHTKGQHVSPGSAMMNADDEVSAAKLSTMNTNASTTTTTTIPSNVVANRSKLTPSPTRSGVVATPASIQSQSDSLSSATTISTATTIIPKEMGEMCRRSSDSDLSVTPKGKIST